MKTSQQVLGDSGQGGGGPVQQGLLWSGEVWPADGMDPVEQDVKDFHVAKGSVSSKLLQRSKVG